MGEQRKVEALRSLEWYDGIVSGVIRSGASHFLCLLLAFDANAARRRYALIPIASDVVPPIGGVDMSDLLRGALQRIRHDGQKVYVTRNEPIVGADIEIEMIADDGLPSIESLQFPRIDDAILPESIARWL